ncbi:hypothetical protein TWF970_001414 [Orbilia oligospora]|uniref:Uncharacterized protein n=1 Tax=Orbilia oligospora TaxID=2813651 RepID=A0A7C8RHD5_ORBOL|nr:hypothetical protein TWF970_001414 [Orbilia oligospora]
MLHNTRQPLTIYMTNTSLKSENYPVNLNDDQGTVKALEESGSEIRYEEVDPTCLNSITVFRHRLQIAHGTSHGTKPLSILVNSPAQEFENAQKAAKLGYFGPKNMSSILLPIMKRDGNSRIVNVSVGGGGAGYWIWKADLADRFELRNLSTEVLDTLVRKYVRDAANGELVEQGWAKRLDVKGPQNHLYVIPRMILGAYTHLLARENPDVLINASGGDLKGVSGRYWIAGKPVDWESNRYKPPETDKVLSWKKPNKVKVSELSPSELEAPTPRPEKPFTWVSFKPKTLGPDS